MILYYSKTTIATTASATTSTSTSSRLLLPVLLIVIVLIAQQNQIQAFVGHHQHATPTSSPLRTTSTIKNANCYFKPSSSSLLSPPQQQQRSNPLINNSGGVRSTSSSLTTRKPLLTPRKSLGSSLQEPIKAYLLSMFRSSGGGVPLGQAFAINALLFGSLIQFVSKMLTGPGILHGVVLGTSLWMTLGWKGWSVCVAYLFLGVLVTKIKFSEKEKLGIAEKRGGKRGPENLWGSAATGLACAIFSRQGTGGSSCFLGIESKLYVLAYVASLATKLADTFASEIGKAYGKTTFLITTFERVEPGTEGAISAEGTAAAVVGGLILSLYGYSLGLISTPLGVIISTTSAFLATNAESLLGATVQEKQGLEWMTNEVINFINTLIGGALAIVGGKFFLL